MSNKISNASSSTMIITKETINRLLHDIRDIIKNPLVDNGIYYIHDDEDLLKGYAMIVGPSDTPYFGGFYFFELHYPGDYPHSPPKVIYKTNGDNIRFNPNLYTCGKVCISLLNTWRGEQWTSCQTISTILLNLCTLLCQDPLLNEPGINRNHNDFKNYTKIIEYKNIEIAMLRMITKNSNSFPQNFNIFYPSLKEVFIKNNDDIKKFLEDKINGESSIEKISTSLYLMNNILIDYKKLYKNYLDVVKEIV